MPLFSVIGADAENGKARTVTIEAANAQQAASFANAQGIFVSHIQTIPRASSDPTRGWATLSNLLTGLTLLVPYVAIAAFPISSYVIVKSNGIRGRASFIFLCFATALSSYIWFVAVPDFQAARKARYRQAAVVQQSMAESLRKAREKEEEQNRQAFEQLRKLNEGK